eukprot:CFRG3756T1
MQSTMKFIAMACGVVVLLSTHCNVATAVTVDVRSISDPAPIYKVQVYTTPDSPGFSNFYNDFSCPEGFAKNMQGSVVQCTSNAAVELDTLIENFSCIGIDHVSFTKDTGVCTLPLNNNMVGGFHVTFLYGQCSLQSYKECNGTEISVLGGITGTFA